MSLVISEIKRRRDHGWMWEISMAVLTVGRQMAAPASAEPSRLARRDSQLKQRAKL
jgi:hypothetical protein